MKKFFTILALALVPIFVEAQNTKVSGIVRDDTGEIMPGVIVIAKDAKGSTISSATTDESGRYTISFDKAESLEYISLGFETVVEKIPKGGRLNVTLSPAASQMLEEAVAIGYGAVKKIDLTGSVENVKMAEIRDAPVLSIDQALQGKVAGLEITSADGEPGSESIIRIRGTRSIEASNDPLIVVDGVMDAVSSLNDINPSDIDAISVLKDASATAIYGSRGSNGVILITTKGTSETDPVQNVSFSFRAQAGVSSILRKLDLMNATEFSIFRNQFYQLSGTLSTMNIETPTSGLSIKDPYARGEGRDWIDEVTRVAPYQNYMLSMSAHQGKQKVYASLAYNDEQGIVKKSGKQNYTGTANYTNKVFSWLTLQANLRYQYREQQNNLAAIGGSSPGSAAIYMSPLISSATGTNQLVKSGTAVNNPSARLSGMINNTNRSMLTIGGSATVTITKDLVWKGKASYYTFGREMYKYNMSTLPAKVEGEGGDATREDYRERKIHLEQTLNYKLSLPHKHKMDFMLGQTAYWFNSDRLYLSGSGYLVDATLWNNMNAVQDKNSYNADSGVVEKLKIAFFGRMNYNWNSRYYLTLTGRFDGASHFAANHKWGFFPSAAVRWNVSKEPFLRNAGWLDNLSLRASVGMSGNDLNTAYRSLSYLDTSTSGYLFGGTQPVSFYTARIASPNLTWEKTTEYNVALDFAVLNNRISLSAEAYLSKTKDLLLNVQVPLQTGYSSQMRNLGGTTTKGVELTVNTRNITRRNFSWLSTFTIFKARSMVDDIGTESYIKSRSSPQGGYMNVGYVKGYPVNSFWGFKYAGVWNNAEEIARNTVTRSYANQTASNELGAPIFLDINHDGSLDSNDICYLGCPDPDFSGGLQNTFRIKGLSLRVFFNYCIGGEVFNYSEYYLGGSRRTNQYRYMINAWHPIANPDSELPRAGLIDVAMPSSFMVHDASFLRLKTVSLGYKWTMKKNWLKELELSVSGDNLYLWSTYNGFDPDVSGWGTKRYDVAAYPKPRRVVFTIQLKY